MTQSTHSGRPAIVPMIAYENGAAALDWLYPAFGFREVERMTEPDRTISHAEMEFADARIFLATRRRTMRVRGGTANPAGRRANGPRSRGSSMIFLVRVDDLDAHFARSKAAGATILSEPEDAPVGRLYRAEDLEGHRWMFIQPP